MLWRLKTLTEFKPSSASSGSREVLDHDVGEVASDEPLGDDLEDLGFEDWDVAGDFCQPLEPSVMAGSGGALELGALEVPRGPVIDDGNFSQMVFKCFH